MNTIRLEPVNAERTIESYSPKYRKVRAASLAYNRSHRLEKRIYMRTYMKEYRTRDGAHEDQLARMILRKYLTGLRKISYKASLKMGITKEQFAAQLGFDHVEELHDYVRSREIDHIVTMKFIRTEHPELLPFVHRYYNLQFLKRKSNRSKGAYVDSENSKVKEILCRMKMDLLASKTDFKNTDVIEMTRYAKQLENLNLEAA